MDRLPVKRINDEVYVADEEIVRLDGGAIVFVRDQALRNPRGRARICAHKDATNSLHEMLIGIAASSYVRPHRHRAKSESFHLVEGSADVVILSDDGAVEDVVALGANANFFYRLEAPRYHTLLVKSLALVIHETTNGPFVADGTDWAPFAPAEGTPEADIYKERLRGAVGAWQEARRHGEK